MKAHRNPTRFLVTVLVCLIPVCLIPCGQITIAQTPVGPNNGTFAELKARAEAGNALAQRSIGNSYFQGSGVAMDKKEAAKWYQKAAEQGDDHACFQLGRLFMDGDGVPEDKIEAAKWYRVAAEKGHKYAQSMLGFQYTLGEGVPMSRTEALQWHYKAALQGMHTSQTEMGLAYLKGDGVPKNAEKAVGWLRLASLGGNSTAQARLGTQYFNGDGVEKDEAEAFRLWRMAAENGEQFAQAKLALLYTYGNGVARNYIDAYRWASLAAAQGIAPAGELMDRLEATMTREEVAEAQKLARDFKTKDALLAEQLASRRGIEDNPAPPSAAQPEALPKASGTGFFVTDDGVFVTNYHVIEGGAPTVIVDGKELPVQVLKSDRANDLAVLKLQSIYPEDRARSLSKVACLPIAPSRGIRLGDSVSTVGFPNITLQGLSAKLARGEIASLTGGGDDARYFQISVPVQPGNSGGALVDARGNVVGVVAAKLSAKLAFAASGALPENVNYAVKSSYLLSLLESLPDVAAKLKEPGTAPREYSDVVQEAEKAAVLILVY